MNQRQIRMREKHHWAAPSHHILDPSSVILMITRSKALAAHFFITAKRTMLHPVVRIRFQLTAFLTDFICISMFHPAKNPDHCRYRFLFPFNSCTHQRHPFLRLISCKGGIELSVKPLLNVLLIMSGIFFVVLGIIGIILPLLPTTPFLLLAAYCFIRSSNKLYQWLIHHRVLGAYIYHYLEHRAVKKSTKIGALSLLWPSLSFSMYIVQQRWLILILFLIGTGVTIHILKLKTYRPEIADSDQLE